MNIVVFYVLMQTIQFLYLLLKHNTFSKCTKEFFIYLFFKKGLFLDDHNKFREM